MFGNMRYEPETTEVMPNGTLTVLVYDHMEKEIIRCYKRKSRIVEFSTDCPVDRKCAAAVRKFLDNYEPTQAEMDVYTFGTPECPMMRSEMTR